MNVYKNKLTGAIIEIPSEFGSDKVWEKISPTPTTTIKADKKEEKPKVKRTVKK